MYWQLRLVVFLVDYTSRISRCVSLCVPRDVTTKCWSVTYIKAIRKTPWDVQLISVRWMWITLHADIVVLFHVKRHAWLEMLRVKHRSYHSVTVNDGMNASPSMTESGTSGCVTQDNITEWSSSKSLLGYGTTQPTVRAWSWNILPSWHTNPTRVIIRPKLNIPHSEHHKGDVAY